MAEHTTSTDRRPSGSRSLAQTAALAVGAMFLLVGVLGFVPGVTTSYGDLMVAGHHSDAQLLGIFQVSILHNVVHLAFGVAGLVLARTHSSARGYLLGGGAIYLVLWVYGLVVDKASQANIVPLDTADDWLHLGLGLAMIGLGVALRRGRDNAPVSTLF